MTIKNLVRNSIGVGLLLLSGCEAARNMRDDFSRLTSSQPTAQLDLLFVPNKAPPRSDRRWAASA